MSEATLLYAMLYHDNLIGHADYLHGAIDCCILLDTRLHVMASRATSCSSPIDPYSITHLSCSRHMLPKAWDWRALDQKG